MLSPREIEELTHLLERNADLDYLSVKRALLVELVETYRQAHPESVPEPPSGSDSESPTEREIREGLLERARQQTDRQRTWIPNRGRKRGFTDD